MEHEKLTEMVYNTDKNISTLSRDFENMKAEQREFKHEIKASIAEIKAQQKEDMAEIKTTLKKICEEPSEDLKYWKKKILNYIVDGILILALLGMGLFTIQKTTEVKQITQEYQDNNK